MLVLIGAWSEGGWDHGEKAPRVLVSEAIIPVA